MPETIYEMSKRMCNGINCENCPLHKAANTICLIGLIKDYEIENVAEQLAVLREWVQEHPAKTYKDVFLEKLPNARINKKDSIPTVCRKIVFGGFTALNDCIDNGDKCKECWNEPYKEENDE